MILVECVTKLSFMQSADYENVIDLFHQPLRDALEHTRHVRRIAKLDDLQYLKCGVDRVLDASLSGREWVQKAAGVFNAPITVSSYFFALNSPKRLELITDVDAWIRNRADQRPGKVTCSKLLILEPNRWTGAGSSAIESQPQGGFRESVLTAEGSIVAGGVLRVEAWGICRTGWSGLV